MLAASGFLATLVPAPAAGSVEAHVVGGDPAPAEEWPWVVAVVDRDASAAEPTCAGTYLGDGWVLTAAHCVPDPAAPGLDVVAGSPRLSEADVRVPVAAATVHPGYDGSGVLADDLALLRTDETLGIPTVRLATPSDWPASSPGEATRVAGWGDTEPDGGGAPDALHAAVTPVLAHIDCAAAVGSGYEAARMLCAGGDGQGTCFGDSGGPLVGESPSGEAVQVGVVSSSVDAEDGAPACGAAPDLYAAVSAYSDWIADETGLVIDDGAPWRVGGADGVATAVEVARHAFGPGQEEAFVAAEGAFPDGLAGGALAAMRGPLLLVPADGPVPAEVLEELGRLRPERITVLGGPAAVSEAVAGELAAVAPLRRLAGANRYETAAEVAGQWRTTSTVVVATGERFPDALAAVPLAAYRGPILLTRADGLPAATAAVIAERAPKRAIVVGGPNAVSEDVVAALDRQVEVVRRVSGSDRYATAAAVATDADNWQEPPFLYAVRGDDHRAALPAGVAASFNASPLVLLPPDAEPATVLDRAALVGAERLVVVGDGVTDAAALGLQARLDAR